MSSSPTLTILGCFKPDIPLETWQQQWEVTASDEYTKEHFDGLVLIEVRAENLDDRFNFNDFGQAHVSGDPNRAMAPYDEGLLSLDGETLLSREMGCVIGHSPVRFAFYLHYYDPARPLTWSYGEFFAPAVQPAPVRLSMLMPYTACS
jgi:hypothetical protein